MSIKVALWFDTSDFINPESEEALAYVLDMLEDLGIRASFKLVGEKVRVLKRNGRDDLLKRLALHDLGYHTDLHSFHPTVTEFCEPLSFSEGAAEFEKREIPGLADVRDILGRRLNGCGQPGEAWAPDVCPALLKQGVDVCLDTHDILRLDGQPFYYGGMLNLNSITRIVRCEYDRENGLQDAIREFDKLAETEYPLGNREETVKLFSVFYHPCEFVNQDHFWDLDNCPAGENRSHDQNGKFIGYLKTPLVGFDRMRERIDTVKVYLSHMLSCGAEFVTMEELPLMVYRRNRAVTLEDVRQISREIVDAASISFAEAGGEFLSPGEIFILLRQALFGEPLKPYLIYGPETRLQSQANVRICREDLKGAMRQFDTVLGYPQLCSAYKVGEQLLSPAEMCYAAAYFLLHEVEVCTVPPVKCIAEQYVAGDPDWSGHWLFPPQFRVDNTYEKTRLQCWTLKPVRFA